MKTYTIYGTNDTKPFKEKYWHPVATVLASSKLKALSEFKHCKFRSSDISSESVKFTCIDAPFYVSYRVRLEH